jgi:hypothetical protein
VVIAAAVGAGLLVSQPAGLSFTIPLYPWPGQAASGPAVAHRTGDGWSIQLTVAHLSDLGAGRFYECWYAGLGSRPGHRQLITAGTFTVGPAATATVQMWSAAGPRYFPHHANHRPNRWQRQPGRANHSPAPRPANPDSGSHTTSGMPAQFAQCLGMSQARTSTKADLPGS